MGTITPRKRKDGSTGYLAQIVVKRDGKIVFRQNLTFDREKAAQGWIDRREKELRKPGALEKEATPDPTLGAVIDQYMRETKRELGRTKLQVLKALKGYTIADKACSAITSADIVSLAQELSTPQRSPQTVANYLSHLGAVFSIARPAWGYPLDPMAMEDAFKVANKLELTRKSAERDRRPTVDEMNRLMAYFGERQRSRRGVAPMQKLLAFAMFSSRRLDEIVRIRWADLDVEHGRVLVRDMKDPSQKRGNNIMCDVPPEAMAIATSMPKVKPEIFPFGVDGTSAAMTRACLILGIDDLHFHDLRHEAISRLFEMGNTIPRVASVSGHRSWNSLKRYTQLRQVGDKWAGWKWLPIVSSAAADWYLQIANVD